MEEGTSRDNYRNFYRCETAKGQQVAQLHVRWWWWWWWWWWCSKFNDEIRSRSSIQTLQNSDIINRLSIFTSTIRPANSRHSIHDEHRAQTVRHVCYVITTPLLDATQFHQPLATTANRNKVFLGGTMAYGWGKVDTFGETAGLYCRERLR